jgi:LuxR family transcriptional regulator, maltose regulon positive regulatory protein
VSARSPAADPLLAGWRELGEARWEEARGLFEGALDGEETPEAWEGLSWAAWWLDDAEAVLGARERAYALYRQAADPNGAARMATWLAVDQLDFRGAHAVAGGWLGRAHRLLDSLEPSKEHGWLAFQEGFFAYAGGDTGRAAELSARAAELGRQLGVPDLEMLGLALEGATSVSCARVDEGMRCLDEATAAALEDGAEIPISGAWTFCFLVTACTATLDFERAAQWCDRLAEFAERYGSRYMLAFCRAEYGAVHLWRGEWDQAEELLEASVEDYTSSRPAWVSGPLVELAELRRRQGRWADVNELLDRAGASSGAHLCRARLALDRGKAAQAVDLGRRLLRQLPEERLVSRAPALELLVHANTARGELDEAAAALTSLRDVAARVGTPALGACADLAEAQLAVARGELDRARTLLEDAADCFVRCGAPFDAARARLELATCLLALGRVEEAEAEAGAAHERLSELGAEPCAKRAAQIVAAAAGGEHGIPLGDLTRRETEVLGLLTEGLTNRQIAERLVVSEHTVHRHVTNLLRKLDLPSRTAAAAHAVRSGLLDHTHN